MDGVIEAVYDTVADSCRVHDCNKDGCSISVRTATPRHVIIDLDCSALRIPRDRKRCDYVFIGEKNRKNWIVPIELKSGGFNAAAVVDQLQGGADVAVNWIPPDVHFLFVPVLAHGTSVVRKKQRTEFRSTKIDMRGRKKQVVMIRCGGTLKDALDRGA